MLAFRMSRDATPLDGLDLNLLVTLRALLRACNVTRAAERLGQSQPSVSRSLQTLRETFRDELLVRSGRGMVTTPLGAALLGPLEQVLLSTDRLREVGVFTPATAARRFRISVADLVAALFIPALAERVMEASPGSTVVVTGSERDQLTSLLRGDIDVAVGLPFEHTEVVHRVIGAADMAWTVVVGPKHPRFGQPMALEDWLASDHVQVVPEGRPDVQSDIDQHLDKRGRRRRVAVQIGHVGALPLLLERTTLVTTLPRAIAERIAEGRSLKVMKHPLGAELPRIRLYLSWHASVQSDAGHAWLREQIVHALDR